jgi:hypothetical protein
MCVLYVVAVKMIMLKISESARIVFLGGLNLWTSSSAVKRLISP